MTMMRVRLRGMGVCIVPRDGSCERKEAVEDFFCYCWIERRWGYVCIVKVEEDGRKSEN